MEKNILFRKYQIGGLLGAGGFAKVYLALNIHSGQKVAIKVMSKQKINEKNIMSNIKREITIMGRLRHPNIVRLYEVLACKRKVYFVIELAKGGELQARIKDNHHFSEELSRMYFQQLISAVGYCHFRGVVHRDLKPQNLLLHDGKLKVSDFGLGAIRVLKDRNDQLLRTKCGTPAFVAPEMLHRREYDGAMVDIWACGVILYLLTVGYLPFDHPNQMAMYRRIMEGRFFCPKWMSSDLIRFLGRLLEKNPNNRITIDEIVHDPWFKKGGLFKGKGPEYKFPFYHDNYGEEFDTSALQQPQQQVAAPEATSSTGIPLNAFDLVALSPALDLLGLFKECYDPFEDNEKFFSNVPVDKILDTIEEVANELDLQVRRRKKYGVADLLGTKGDLIARVEIDQLTEEFVIVELKIKGDFVSDNEIWKKKLMPKLSELIYRIPESKPLEEEKDTKHEDEQKDAKHDDEQKDTKRDDDEQKDTKHDDELALVVSVDQLTIEHTQVIS
ncbi:CBL-interacting serine/threonine-protein kinase 14-like [Chenopodium quinoa]|uniref:non-specific serine/threonine protein kinase n=1 Tax=Chenopodium quinoa TaxID=63459 RepID=A0A803MLG7_CHEQI|nr:CBL-interacting serine/threonine-protein kinase 14-like [Chenopodium quinoa]